MSISSLKSLAIATAMSAFFALILKIIYIALLCTYFVPVALGLIIRFGLVYQHAITQNKSGDANIHKVKYTLNGSDIAINIYTSATGTK